MHTHHGYAVEATADSDTHTCEVCGSGSGASAQTSPRNALQLSVSQMPNANLILMEKYNKDEELFQKQVKTKKGINYYK